MTFGWDDCSTKLSDLKKVIGNLIKTLEELLENIYVYLKLLKTFLNFF